MVGLISGLAAGEYSGDPTRMQLLIESSIQYNKKPGKPAAVKVVKDPSVPRDDIYKSGEIHTGPGEPPSSVSRPTPRGKQIASKPITQGKLLRPGGPGGAPSKLASRPAPQSRPLPQKVAEPASVPVQRTPISQPVAALNGTPHARITSSSSATSVSARPVPPPPPPQPAQPAAHREPTYRALYDFAGQSAGELSIMKDEVILIEKQEQNGASRSPSLLSVPSPLALHTQSSYRI